MPETSKTLFMKVSEAYPEDYGEGRARITYNTMQELSLQNNDILEVRKGKGKWMPARCQEFWFQPNEKVDDSTESPIKIDGFLRSSIEAEIGDTVEVRKVAKPLREAEGIMVTPLQSIPPIESKEFAKAFHDIPVVKGEIIRMNYYGRELTFRVASTHILDDDTLLKRMRYCIPIIPTDNPIIIKAAKTTVGLTVHRPEIAGCYGGGIVFEEEYSDPKGLELVNTTGLPVLSLDFKLDYDGSVEKGEFRKPIGNVKHGLLASWSEQSKIMTLYMEPVGEVIDKYNKKLKAERIAPADLTHEQKLQMLKALGKEILARWEDTWKKEQEATGKIQSSSYAREKELLS